MRRDFRPSGSTTPTTGKLVPIGAKLGAEESGHTTQHAISPESSTEHMFLGERGGGFPNL